MDPRVASQQPVLEAQQRLMRTADVADRAAAELRGEADQAESGGSSEYDEFAPGGATSAINKDASTRSASDPTTTQPRNPAAGHEGAAAATDSGARNGSMASRTAGTSAHAATPAQQSGGSHEGNGESRQQTNNGAPINAGNRAAAAAQAKLGAADSSSASAASSARTTSTMASPASSTASSVAGPGSLATVRDPLRAFTARPEPKASKPQSEPANLPNQVARGLAAAVRQRDGTLTLRLSPDSLGDIRIQVRVESGQVSAHIDAQTEQARQLLTESASTLRSALEAHGLVVERIEVAPAERHATMDLAMAPTAHFAEHRAQGGALSVQDQPPSHGFGDGAPPDHRDTNGHNSGSRAQDVAPSTDPPRERFDLPSGGVAFERIEDRWVLRVDLVA